MEPHFGDILPTARHLGRVLLALGLLSVLLAACMGARPSLPAQPIGPVTLATDTPSTSATPSPLPTYTLEPVLHALPNIVPRPRATRTSRPRPTADASRLYPVSHTIESISGHRQRLSLGCEASAAVDWAAYFGVQIDEGEFQKALPLSDNPEKGFVGDVNGQWGQIPPHPYGVHAGPVAELLRTYSMQAWAQKNYTLDQVKIQVAKDNPVIVWVIGNMTGGSAQEYTDAEGEIVIVAAYEHVVIITGYDEETGKIRYLNNGHSYEVPEEIFLDSWGVLGNLAVTRDEA